MAFQPLFIRGWKQLSAYIECLLLVAVIADQLRIFIWNRIWSTIGNHKDNYIS